MYSEAEKLISLMGSTNIVRSMILKDLRSKIAKLYELTEKDGIPKRICHNNCFCQTS